jgi:hypothetical protein
MLTCSAADRLFCRFLFCFVCSFAGTAMVPPTCPTRLPPHQKDSCGWGPVTAVVSAFCFHFASLGVIYSAVSGRRSCIVSAAREYCCSVLWSMCVTRLPVLTACDFWNAFADQTLCFLEVALGLHNTFCSLLRDMSNESTTCPTRNLSKSRVRQFKLRLRFWPHHVLVFKLHLQHPHSPAKGGGSPIDLEHSCTDPVARAPADHFVRGTFEYAS